MNSRTIRNNMRQLRCAINEGNVETVKELLQKGININDQNGNGETILYHAVNAGHLMKEEKDFEKLIKILLEFGAEINGKNKIGVTPLHVSAERGHEEICKMLLIKGADVNAVNEHEETALHFAAQKGREETVKLLLEFGAKIDCKNVYGDTPLHFAADRGKKEICKMLLIKGADVNALTRKKETALHMAVKNGHVETVKFLLEFGAEINCKNKNGATPLHFSARQGNKEIIKMLLIKGADVNAVNLKNETALHIAVKLSYNERNAVLLLEFGADFDFFKYLLFCGQSAFHFHFIKRAIANLFVLERYSLFSSETYLEEKFQKECEKEILYLKNEKINDTNISFFDILINYCSLFKYMKNENIVQTLKSLDYEAKFPFYGNMINCNFIKCMKRRGLLDQCYQFFPLFYNNFTESPQCYHEKILSFLNDEDLSILIKACQPLVNLNL
ncbi:ankyrin repeat, PH and SEC7 domain containing protein secG-like [Leptopilina heterotoma]|uniref:ankyrin repeat, PH and SEC7 domain containing protein secG-like n=1 Tax=Leptopilina heterotoma TaxID=63436 RepID=UPI001CA8309E|nr:ankyrin repeat, PH and SEC7 domain containing protein secG-like [Leptopilina heterotoma]